MLNGVRTLASLYAMQRDPVLGQDMATPLPPMVSRLAFPLSHPGPRRTWSADCRDDINPWTRFAVSNTIRATSVTSYYGKKMDQQIISFTMERETKNTIRYQEESNGNPPAIGTLYQQKWLLGETTPVKLQVTVSEAVSPQQPPDGYIGEITNQQVVQEVGG